MLFAFIKSLLVSDRCPLVYTVSQRTMPEYFNDVLFSFISKGLGDHAIPTTFILQFDIKRVGKS